MKIGIEYDVLSPVKAIPEGVGIVNVINPLIPNFLEDAKNASLPDRLDVDKEVIVDGSFIDLNPGTPEKAVRRIVFEKVDATIEFAKRYRASEVIFLSNFLPFLNEKAFYESWFFENAISFWTETVALHPNARISLANVFEFSPEPLLRIVEGVNAPNLGIAFDIGHALAFSKVNLHDWYRDIKPHMTTLYAHSNDRAGDQHAHLWEGAFQGDPGIQALLRELTAEKVLLKSFEKGNYAEDIAILNRMNQG